MSILTRSHVMNDALQIIIVIQILDATIIECELHVFVQVQVLERELNLHVHSTAPLIETLQLDDKDLR